MSSNNGSITNQTMDIDSFQEILNIPQELIAATHPENPEKVESQAENENGGPQLERELNVSPQCQSEIPMDDIQENPEKVEKNRQVSAVDAVSDQLLEEDPAEGENLDSDFDSDCLLLSPMETGSDEAAQNQEDFFEKSERSSDRHHEKDDDATNSSLLADVASNVDESTCGPTPNNGEEGSESGPNAIDLLGEAVNLDIPQDPISAERLMEIKIEIGDELEVKQESLEEETDVKEELAIENTDSPQNQNGTPMEDIQENSKNTENKKEHKDEELGTLEEVVVVGAADVENSTPDEIVENGASDEIAINETQEALNQPEKACGAEEVIEGTEEPTEKDTSKRMKGSICPTGLNRDSSSSQVLPESSFQELKSTDMERPKHLPENSTNPQTQSFPAPPQALCSSNQQPGPSRSQPSGGFGMFGFTEEQLGQILDLARAFSLENRATTSSHPDDPRFIWESNGVVARQIVRALTYSMRQQQVQKTSKIIVKTVPRGVQAPRSSPTEGDEDESAPKRRKANDGEKDDDEEDKAGAEK